MKRKIITEAFISEVANTLGETEMGLTGTEICKHLVAHAATYNRNIPYTVSPFKKKDGTTLNKRTALKCNLMCFSDNELYIIILDLCGLDKFSSNKDVEALKSKLFRDYHALAPIGEIEEEFIEETSHWLKDYPKVMEQYEKAYTKCKSKDEQLYRNTLDDSRLALEELLKKVLANDKSMENQKETIGKFISEKGGTAEFSNMFWKLLDHYSKYQNNKVKHNENIVKNEIVFIFELTTVFMRQLVRLNS